MTRAVLLVALALAPQHPAPPAADSAWAPLARYLELRIAGGAFPGAVVAVGRRDTVLYLHAFGHLDDTRGVPVATGTVYDIASLTKVVGLTTALMMLVDEGRLDLDAPATRYVPAFRAGGDSITVRMLLTHSAGLPAWQPYFREVRSREAMFQRVNAEPLEQPPGTRTVYSDLGAMLLTEIAERLAGERLDRFMARRLFRPLTMRDTRFRPPRSWLARTAPTFHDPRGGREGHGTVNDENAYAMGGISGHAGLFSTAPDLARFAQFMLRGGTAAASAGRPNVRSRQRAAVSLVRAETIAAFRRAQNPAFSSRALGWDTPSQGSSAGTKLSAHAFGHTGFTGTSLWIDPDQDLFIILLTNRHHPTPEVRSRVADLAAETAAPR